MRNVCAGTLLAVTMVALLACGGTDTAEEGMAEGMEASAEEAGAAQEHAGAVTADPDHYSVEFENDVVRLVRIQYGPGETSVMHRHPANCAIFIEDQPTRMELPSGEVVENEPAAPGEVSCFDAEVHLPTNVGEGELELILIEFKGRETVQ